MNFRRVSVGLLLLPWASAVLPAGAVPPTCSEEFSQLAENGVLKSSVFRRRLERRISYQLLRPLAPLRDLLKYRLQVLNGHPYPIMAIDESPRAFGWAKHLFGKLDEESAGLLEVDKIEGELQAALKRVRAYGADVEGLVDRNTNLLLFREALQRELKARATDQFGRVRYPVIARGSKGALKVESSEAYFGTRAQMEIEFRRIRKQLRELEREGADRLFEQQILIKKLETYRHEAIRQSTALGGVEFSSSVKELLEGIAALQVVEKVPGGGIPHTRTQFSPPEWVRQRLKWMQLGREFESIVMTDIPKLKNDERLGKVMKYIQSLSESEKRMLGLQNTSDKIEWYKRTKWVRIAATTGGIVTAGGVTFGEKGMQLVETAWDYLWEDQRRKEECAGKPSPEEFAECATIYLQDKFPERIFLVDRSEAELFDQNSRITDPEIAVEVADLLERRNRFVYETNRKGQFEGPARAGLLLSDRSSASYRDALVRESNDEVFSERLLSERLERGYLMFNYSSVYRKAEVRRLVRAVMAADSQEMRALMLTGLERTLPGNRTLEKLARDLEEILELREAFKEGRLDVERTDRRIAETLEQLVDAREDEPEGTPGSSP